VVFAVKRGREGGGRGLPDDKLEKVNVGSVVRLSIDESLEVLLFVLNT